VTALIEGFRKESEALLAGRGVLTADEWNHYAAAIYDVQDALEEARFALQMAARSWCGRMPERSSPCRAPSGITA
jgi:hypothetical protein